MTYALQDKTGRLAAAGGGVVVVFVAMIVRCDGCEASFRLEPITVPRELFEDAEVDVLPGWCPYCGGAGAVRPASF